MVLSALERTRRTKAWKLRSAANDHRPLTFDPVIAVRLIDKQLAAHRLSVHALAAASGVPEVALARIRRGAVGYVRRSTLVALRTLPHLTPPTRAPAGGTIARLHMLSAHGYSVADLTAHFGRGVQPYGRTSVTVKVAQEVIDATRVLGAAPGPHPFAAKHAAKKGYLPPSAFDQDTLVDLLWDGTGGLLHDPTAGELAVEARFLASQGSTVQEIGDQLGQDLGWVRDTLRRAIKATETVAA